MCALPWKGPLSRVCWLPWRRPPVPSLWVPFICFVLFSHAAFLELSISELFTPKTAIGIPDGTASVTLPPAHLNGDKHFNCCTPGSGCMCLAEEGIERGHRRQSWGAVIGRAAAHAAL